MLSLVLTLSGLTSTWTYAGFIANPPPSPLAAPTAPPTSSGRSSPPAVPVAAPISPPPTAVRFRMADAAGQVWEHPDPAILQAFIFDRNTRSVPPLPVSRNFGLRR